MREHLSTYVIRVLQSWIFGFFNTHCFSPLTFTGVHCSSIWYRCGTERWSWQGIRVFCWVCNFFKIHGKKKKSTPISKALFPLFMDKEINMVQKIRVFVSGYYDLVMCFLIWDHTAFSAIHMVIDCFDRFQKLKVQDKESKHVCFFYLFWLINE